jgi:hypothetical protein
MSWVDFIDVIFLTLNALVLLASVRSTNVVAATQLGCFFIFFILAHVVWRISNDYEYDTFIYFTTHGIVFTYFALFAALTTKDRRSGKVVVTALMALPQLAFAIPILFWGAVTAYIYAVYGTFGFMNSDDASDATAHRFSNGDDALIGIASTLASGVGLAFAGRAALDSRIFRSAIAVVPLVIYVILLFGSGAGNMAGARRTLLIWVVFYLIISFQAPSIITSPITRLNLRSSIIATAFLMAGVGYYQSIRLNVWKAEIQQGLTSPSWGDRLNAVGVLLTPDPTLSSEAGGIVNRSGPFDFLYLLNVQVFDNGHLTDGDLTLFSLSKAVPKVFWPGKPQYDTDLEFSHIYGPSLAREKWLPPEAYDELDFSSSVTSIFVADFGLIGPVLAAVLMYICYALINFFMARRPWDAILNIGCLSAIFLLLGSIESSLEAVLATMRFVFIVVVAAGLMKTILAIVAAPLRRGPRQPPASSSPQPDVAQSEPQFLRRGQR